MFDHTGKNKQPKQNKAKQNNFVLYLLTLTHMHFIVWDKEVKFIHINIYVYILYIHIYYRCVCTTIYICMHAIITREKYAKNLKENK